MIIKRQCWVLDDPNVLQWLYGKDAYPKAGLTFDIQHPRGVGPEGQEVMTPKRFAEHKLQADPQQSNEGGHTPWSTGQKPGPLKVFRTDEHMDLRKCIHACKQACKAQKKYAASRTEPFQALPTLRIHTLTPLSKASCTSLSGAPDSCTCTSVPRSRSSLEDVR